MAGVGEWPDSGGRGPAARAWTMFMPHQVESSHGAGWGLPCQRWHLEPDTHDAAWGRLPGAAGLASLCLGGQPAPSSPAAPAPARRADVSAGGGLSCLFSPLLVGSPYLVLGFSGGACVYQLVGHTWFAPLCPGCGTWESVGSLSDSGCER